MVFNNMHPQKSPSCVKMVEADDNYVVVSESRKQAATQLLVAKMYIESSDFDMGVSMFLS